MFCKNCGKEIIDEKQKYCDGCGCILKEEEECGKNWLYTLILNWFLGCTGAHRFYTGYIGIGIAQLLTIGGLGIWSFIDMVSIGSNKFKNAKGEELIGYNKWIGIMGIAYAFMVIGCIILIILMAVLLILLTASGALE